MRKPNFKITIEAMNKARKIMREALAVTSTVALISTGSELLNTVPRINVTAATLPAIPLSNTYPEIENGKTVFYTETETYYLDSATDGIYPETFMVTDIKQEVNPASKNQNPVDALYLTCSNGNVFKYFPEDGAEDWLIGDMASAIMGDNSTPYVSDDYIISLVYAGYPGCESWAYVPYRPYEMED